ncbi:MAG: SgcJ/EcaC family oxidoreductase [Caldilineaceae bacterium]
MTPPITEKYKPTTHATTANNGDEAAVRQLFQQLMDAWAAGDAHAYAALFTADADYIAFDGVNQKGRAAIEAGHKPLFDRFLKGSKLTGGLVSLTQLAPNVIMAHAEGSILDAGRRAPDPERLSNQTLIAVKEEGHWRFRAFHNTRAPINGGVRNLIAWLLADRIWRLLGKQP